VYLDLDVTVPVASGMAHFENLGVTLTCEILVDGASEHTANAQMPAACQDAMRGFFRDGNWKRTRYRHVCRVATLAGMREGAELILRGQAERVGPTTTNVINLWVG
jgi:hypothetical protein